MAFRLPLSPSRSLLSFHEGEPMSPPAGDLAIYRSARLTGEYSARANINTQARKVISAVR